MLRQQGWEGLIQICNCPFCFLDIHIGKREVLRQVHGKEAFRYLGVQINPAMDWEAHKRKVANDLCELMQQLQVAKHGWKWGPGMVT